jgi:transposase-like protein
MNYRCNYYQTTRAIFEENSIFNLLKIEPKKVLKSLVYMCQMETLTKVSLFVGVSQNTLTKLKSLIVLKIRQYFETYPIKLGGPGVIVHVDETMLTHTVRAHRGRSPRTQVWALTMVDTSFTPSRGFIKIVSSKDAQTLLPIINNVVRAGSIIHTDEWAAYRQLGADGRYEHRTLVHKYNFVDPQTGVHTQNVESFNNKLKYFIKQAKGVAHDKRLEFVDFFLFIDLHKERAFERIVELLKICDS